MSSDGPSPHSPSLRLGHPAPQPSRHHHAQSLLGPSFQMTQERIMFSNPTPSKPCLSPAKTMSDATRSHSVLALHLYLAAYNTSSSCRF